MMEAHRNAWMLVMESEQHSANQVNALIDSLFANAIKFSMTIDDGRVSANSSRAAGEVTALRTLVDYVHEAKKQGHHESIDYFYQNISSALLANNQLRNSIVGLLNHFEQTTDRDDHNDYIDDLSVLQKILAQISDDSSSTTSVTVDAIKPDAVALLRPIAHKEIQSN